MKKSELEKMEKSQASHNDPHQRALHSEPLLQIHVLLKKSLKSESILISPRYSTKKYVQD